MNSAAAARFLRSCTATLSTRHVARSAAVSRPLTRLYSTETEKHAEAEAAKEQDKTEAGTTEPAGFELAEKLKAKEEEVADLTSRLRYLQADFMNLQRNAAREKEQTKDFAITRFAKDLLETVDVLSLALKSVPSETVSSPSSSTDTASKPSSSSSLKPPEDYLRELYTGVELTQRQLLQTLFKYNVKPFDPTGDAFDPNKHEALYQAPIPGKEPGTVIDCQKTGYMIKERVLRAAQVGVAQESS